MQHHPRASDFTHFWALKVKKTEWWLIMTNIIPVKFSLSVVEPQNTDLWLCPCRNGTVLNSKVLSVTIKPTPSSLAAPVTVEFSHLYNVSYPFSSTDTRSDMKYFLNETIWCFLFLRARLIRPAYRGMRATGKTGQLVDLQHYWPVLY